MSRMFGDRIDEFVLSVDIMDEETFHDLLRLIELYVQEHLNVAYFSVLDESTVNNQTGLRTIWSSREERPAYSVDKESGYTSHSAYTFGENRPIWVVSASKQALHGAEDLIDLWNDSGEDLPSYGKSIHKAVRTSVMHPLRWGGRTIGVVEFAAEGYVKPTPAGRKEVEKLAGVISRAYQMFEVRRAQRANTKRAMQMLEDAFSEEDWGRLALPQIFVAYPGGQELEPDAREGHAVVISTIRAVVGEFDDILQAVYWEDVTEAGNITAQVIRDIGSSDFGLCYFSEPGEDGEFEDNPNVLFEAGMMQALTNSPGAPFAAWIPIRERAASDIPFDIAAERILLVNRAENGTLDGFAGDLKARIQNLIESYQPHRVQNAR